MVRTVGTVSYLDHLKVVISKPADHVYLSLHLYLCGMGSVVWGTSDMHVASGAPAVRRSLSLSLSLSSLVKAVSLSLRCSGYEMKKSAPA